MAGGNKRSHVLKQTCNPKYVSPFVATRHQRVKVKVKATLKNFHLFLSLGIYPWTGRHKLNRCMLFKCRHSRPFVF